MKNTTKLSLLGVVVLCGAAAGVWWSMGRVTTGRNDASPEKGPVAPPAQVVTLAVVQRQDVPVNLVVNGNVVSLNSVDVRPQISNLVQRVHVKEGQFVRAGETLFSLDDRADRANLDKARAQQARDEAVLADLERQYKRSQDLVAQSFIAQSAADNTLSQVQAQRALVDADRAAVQAAQVALSYDLIRSPINGRIGAVNLFAGSLAQPTVSLLTVTQLDPIAISFPVPEAQVQDLLAGVASHAKVSATVPGGRSALIGSLSFLDNTVDPQAGTVRAKALFGNKAQQLWPGQYVSTEVTLRVLKDVGVLPQAAIVNSTAGSSVYVVGADDSVQARKVAVDYSFADQAVVRGVQPGERVVVEGKQNLRPGARIRVEKPAQADTAKKDKS